MPREPEVSYIFAGDSSMALVDFPKEKDGYTTVFREGEGEIQMYGGTSPPPTGPFKPVVLSHSVRLERLDGSLSVPGS